MNVEKIVLSENLYSLCLRFHPRKKGEPPLEIAFDEAKSTMSEGTLAEMAVYLENPTYRIIYNYDKSRDIKIKLKRGESPFIRIDHERALCYMGTSFYLLSYVHQDERKNDKRSFSRLLSEKPVATKDKQVPEIMATFDYNQKYYLVLRIRVIASGKTTQSMYKGIIVKPQAYENAYRSTNGQSDTLTWQ
jgi:hypothetical protein